MNCINSYKTEYLIKGETKGSQDVNSVVIYKIAYCVDEDEFFPVRLYVAAKGYAGRHVNEDCIAVADFDNEGNISDYQIFNMDAIFNRGEDPEFEELSSPDVTILTELVEQIFEELILIDDNGDDFMTSRITIPEDKDYITSSGWDPDNLLEGISQEWGLFLTF